MTVDSCGEGCAQLDDFKWFLPTDGRAGDLTAPESEIETSGSESGVEFIEPDSTPLQDGDDGSAVVMPSGGRSDETYGGLSHSSAPAIASGT